MNLRPQMFNMLVATKGIEVCPSCSRMVYAAEVIDGPPAPKPSA
jgi:predicted  nucleic acid-binding Zn-ribbon protein